MNQIKLEIIERKPTKAFVMSLHKLQAGKFD